MLDRFSRLIFKGKGTQRLLNCIVVDSLCSQLSEQNVRAFSVRFFVGADIGRGKFLVV